MKDETAKLTPKQETALVALLTFSTLAEAAKACRMSETTLWRMQQEPAFLARLQKARRETMEQAVGALQKATGTASGTLLAIMQDTNAPASVRVSAARSVLEYAFKGVEMLETNIRLTAIEETLQQQAEKQT